MVEGKEVREGRKRRRRMKGGKERKEQRIALTQAGLGLDMKLFL